jgi:hypothetical protein
MIYKINKKGQKFLRVSSMDSRDALSRASDGGEARGESPIQLVLLLSILEKSKLHRDRGRE